MGHSAHAEEPRSLRMVEGSFVTELLTRNREKIIELAARFGARSVRVFGSHARGDAVSGSDVDLLVDLEDGRTLFDHVGLWQELEELLGCRVDVVVTGGISPYLKDRIVGEAKPL